MYTRCTHGIPYTRYIVSICVLCTVGQYNVYLLCVVHCRSECVLKVHIVYLPQGPLYLCALCVTSILQAHIIYLSREPMYLSVCGVL